MFRLFCVFYSHGFCSHIPASSPADRSAPPPRSAGKDKEQDEWNPPHATVRHLIRPSRPPAGRRTQHASVIFTRKYSQHFPFYMQMTSGIKRRRISKGFVISISCQAQIKDWKYVIVPFAWDCRESKQAGKYHFLIKWNLTSCRVFLNHFHSPLNKYVKLAAKASYGLCGIKCRVFRKQTSVFIESQDDERALVSTLSKVGVRIDIEKR